MKIKTFLATFALLVTFLLSSCSSAIPSLGGKDTPDLFPIRQNDKWGYINKKGEVVIQPQFQGGADAFSFFSEGLAVICIEGNKCGYIDETGRFVINPQFEHAFRFSEGLAAVEVREQIGNTSKLKVGYIDKTGKFVINPQFESIGISEFYEGLASVKIGDKVGFIDKTGRIIINPQFEYAYPFTEGLAAVGMGGKVGFVDKEGKIVVNPQFEQATPFTNGLAAVKIGKQYGYADKTGKIIINPQFDGASPFSEEGLAMITVGGKVGFVDKEGKYVINPQFDGKGSSSTGMTIATFFWGIKELRRTSFSDGLALIQIGNSFGYIDTTGKIVINPQFSEAFPFYGGLALVSLGSGSDKGMAYIDKEGKTVWRETKQTPNTYSNSSISNSNVAVVVNSNSNVAVVTNTNTRYGNVTMDSPPQSSNNSTSSERTGRLTTDANIRSEPNKDAASLGIHFKDAKVKILDETSYATNDGETTWYKIRVTEYGCSKDANIGCGKNTPNDSDEGWVNAKNISGVTGMTSRQPKAIESNYYVRVYNVDDLATVYVSGSKVSETSFNRNENRDITKSLRPGSNEVRFVLQNSRDGFTYGFEIYQGKTSIFKDECGVVGYSGCRGNSQTGLVYDRTVTVETNVR